MDRRARLLLLQPLCQLHGTDHKLAMSNETHPSWGFRSGTSDSANREPSCWWCWQQQSVARQRASAALTAACQASPSRGHASHHAVSSRGSSGGSPRWFRSMTLTAVLASPCSHPQSKSSTQNFFRDSTRCLLSFRKFLLRLSQPESASTACLEDSQGIYYVKGHICAKSEQQQWHQAIGGAATKPLWAGGT